MARKKVTKFNLKSGPWELDFFYALARSQRVVFYTDKEGEWLRVYIDCIKASFSFVKNASDKVWDNNSMGKVWEFEGSIDDSNFDHSMHAHIKGKIDYSKFHAGKERSERAEGITGWIKVIG